jgi:terminase small subunit-like protein
LGQSHATWYPESMANDLTPKNLSARQAAFVAEYVSGGNAHAAALSAGYAEGTARVAGTQLLESPNIALAIAKAVRIRLASAAPMALNVLTHLAEKGVSERVRMESASRLLDRAGHVPPRPTDNQSKPDAPLHEYTVEQLHEIIAGRAKNVTPAPAEEPIG